MVQPLWLIGNPSPEGELPSGPSRSHTQSLRKEARTHLKLAPSGLEIDVRNNGRLQALDNYDSDINLGPISLHVSSPHLTVASLLFLSITFERPPEGLKIMSVSAHILQSFDISFTDKSIQPVKPTPQKKLLFWVDS